MHHVPARRWFVAAAETGWSTAPLTESGFVRVSSNPAVLPSPIGIREALRVLAAFRGLPGHRFLADDVSVTDADVPAISGHRQVTDAHLLTLARRHGVRLVTFDAGLLALGGAEDVELLRAL